MGKIDHLIKNFCLLVLSPYVVQACARIGFLFS